MHLDTLVYTLGHSYSPRYARTEKLSEKSFSSKRGKIAEDFYQRLNKETILIFLTFVTVLLTVQDNTFYTPLILNVPRPLHLIYQWQP